MQRRGFMGAIAALAATRWENDGLDPDEIEQWEPLSGPHTTGEFTPKSLDASGRSIGANWLCEDSQLPEKDLRVTYSISGIRLVLSGEGESLKTSTGANLTSDQAREMAAALWQAAEELDRRGQGGGEDV